MKSMTVLTLLMVALCGVNQGKTEAASKPASHSLFFPSLKETDVF